MSIVFSSAKKGAVILPARLPACLPACLIVRRFIMAVKSLSVFSVFLFFLLETTGKQSHSF